jgi:hypothetical protein
MAAVRETQGRGRGELTRQAAGSDALRDEIPPVGSGDVGRVAELIALFSDPSAGTAGIVHRGQFSFADMVDRDVVCSAILAVQVDIGRVAQMTGIIGNGAAVLTSVGHYGPPYSSWTGSPAFFV